MIIQAKAVAAKLLKYCGLGPADIIAAEDDVEQIEIRAAQYSGPTFATPQARLDYIAQRDAAAFLVPFREFMAAQMPRLQYQPEALRDLLFAASDQTIQQWREENKPSLYRDHVEQELTDRLAELRDEYLLFAERQLDHVEATCGAETAGILRRPSRRA